MIVLEPSEVTSPVQVGRHTSLAKRMTLNEQTVPSPVYVIALRPEQ